MDETQKRGLRLNRSACPNAKRWMVFLTILIVVVLSLAAIRMIFRDRLVIYAQKDKPDIMQVFFQTDGTYSEQNSAKTKVLDSSANGLSINLPLAPIHYLRIDPASEAARVVIKKIELRHLFGTDVYSAEDLAIYSKPLMMIDKMVVTPGGLAIDSTGNDPAFELQLKKTSLLSQLTKLCIAAVLLSITTFLVITRFARKNNQQEIRIVYLLTIPLWMSLGIVAIFYPGSMSYDTLHALRSARNGVTDSMWPPMVSYVWRVVDSISTNPAAMHFSQVLLLLLSIFNIVFLFTNKIRLATIFLLVYLIIPVVLGTVAVIWKDVLMAAFFMAGIAVMIFMRNVLNRWQFIVLSLVAAFMIFLGVCSRHNAIAGGVPLLFYLSFIVCSRLLPRPRQLWFGAILLGTVLTGTVFFTKIQLDKFSLPSFTRLGSANDFFIRTVRVLDVAGASLCVGSNLFADLAPSLTLSEISKTYDPKHINLSQGLLAKVGVDSRIDKVWLNVAISHPICFFNNKFQMTKYLVGANDGDQFLVTHSTIDDNEYGYSLPTSSIRTSVVTYIMKASNLLFFRPWFLYVVSLFSFAYLIRIGALTADYLVLFLSAIFYFASLVAFGNAADARLPFYTTTALLMLTFISITEFKKKRYT